MNSLKQAIRNRIGRVLDDCERAAQMRRGGLTYRSIVKRIRERHAIVRQASSGVRTFGVGEFMVECLNPNSFTTLYDEIFLQDAYCFRAKTESPRIIDCGVNIGLALLYFKHIYTRSTIIGFEPHPAACRVAERNLQSNRIEGVELIEAAISNRDGHAELNFMSGEVMASTLTNRLHQRGCHVEATKVKTVRLRPWLEERVDFLKLDIEGSEAAVLADCQDLLGNVENIFVEGHWTRGQSENTAAAVVGVLEKAGFNILILSTENNRANSFRPIRQLGPVTSFIVYGTR